MPLDAVKEEKSKDVEANSDKQSNPKTAAAHKLALAKSLLRSNPMAAKKRLEEVISSFPNTEAATESRKLLDEMK